MTSGHLANRVKALKPIKVVKHSGSGSPKLIMFWGFYFFPFHKILIIVDQHNVDEK